MGLPCLQALVGGGGVFAFVIHFSGGGASELPWGGGGLNSGVWEGVLFFVSNVHFVNQI